VERRYAIDQDHPISVRDRGVFSPRVQSPITPSPSLQRARLAASLSLFGLAALLLVSPFISASRVAPPQPVQIDPFADAIPLPADAEEKLSSADLSAQIEGASELIGAIESRWPDDHRRSFLVAVAPGALGSAVEHCIPPSVTVGQAVLESGWGRSGLAKRHKNLFGLKAGASSNGVELSTTEVVSGKARKTRERFRTYDDYRASVAHHDRLLADDPRYAAARAHWENWPLFLATVAPTYASDPKYVARISQLVKTYRLDEWDALVTRVARRRASCTEL